ncbi:MAG TPA: ribosomal protein S18-alanine N-acetyltransferase [Candidatus Koribacter sp.]|jgi:ribosomal-protein-alanine N-acetyltransferase
MSDCFIRESTPLDLPAILEIERANPSAAHWNEAAYAELWNNPETTRIGFVAEFDGVIAAFVVAHNVTDDWELENIAVRPDAQRQGIARALIGKLDEVLKKAGAERILLEVREGNSAARQLYESNGFVIVGRRKSYYQSPQEDALLFEKNFTHPSMKIR